MNNEYTELFKEIIDLPINNLILDKKNKLYNQNDKYIEGTEKLWKLEKPKYIQDLFIKEEILGRKFLNKNNSISYFEIFEDQRFKILGLSKKISLLYSPSNNNIEQYNKEHCFGFRFYSKSKKEKCKYFTLINKYNKKYYILEKNQNIKDISDDLIYEESLDCYSIIRSIIFEKYKGLKYAPNGELFPELIGYIYALKSLKKFKNFIPIEPFIPDKTDENSLDEDLPEILEKDIGYLEPILYDDHISVYLIKKSNDETLKRFNILFDMSRHFADQKVLDSSIFPKEIYKGFYPYPNISIQKHNTCGLWFYGIIECIYTKEIYRCPKDIILSIKDNTFYLDVINTLSGIIYNNNNIIDNRKIDKAQICDLDNRIFKNALGEHFSFTKEIICNNCFFSLSNAIGYMENFYNKNEMFGIRILCEYQLLFDDIHDYLRILKLNYDYFKSYYNLRNPLNEIKIFENQINTVNNFLECVQDNFQIDFENTVYYYYELNYENQKLTKEIKENFEKKEKNNKKAEDSYYILKSKFGNIKKRLSNIALLTENQIIKNLNPNGSILFQVMK